MLFDRGGAARSVARARPCLTGLPEGEGCAFTLTTLGVWLVQIPDVKMWMAAGEGACLRVGLS